MERRRGSMSRLAWGLRGGKGPGSRCRGWRVLLSRRTMVRCVCEEGLGARLIGRTALGEGERECMRYH